MELKIDVPNYEPEKGFVYKWEGGFKFFTTKDNESIIIAANKEGLISLANHLLNLAQVEIPSGYHLHFDEHNSLEMGSTNLVIEKL